MLLVEADEERLEYGRLTFGGRSNDHDAHWDLVLRLQDGGLAWLCAKEERHVLCLEIRAIAKPWDGVCVIGDAMERLKSG